MSKLILPTLCPQKEEREEPTTSSAHALSSLPEHFRPLEGSREARPLLAPPRRSANQRPRASRVGPPLTLRTSLRTRQDTPLPRAGPPRALAPWPHARGCRCSLLAAFGGLARVPRSVLLTSHSPSPSGSWPEVSGWTENAERRWGSPGRGLRGAAERSEVNAWPALSDPRRARSRRSRWAGPVPAPTSVSGRRNRGCQPGRPAARDCGGRKVRDEFQCPKGSNCTTVFQCPVFVRIYGSPRRTPPQPPGVRLGSPGRTRPPGASGSEPGQRWHSLSEGSGDPRRFRGVTIAKCWVPGQGLTLSSSVGVPAWALSWEGGGLDCR